MVELLFARFGLGIGLLFDFGQNFLRAGIGRQFAHHHTPLAARQLFDFIARTHAHAAFSAFVNVLQIGSRRDDLAAAGKIGSRHISHQISNRHGRLFQQRYRRLGDFGEIVRRNFGGHAHGNARCAVEQHHRQPRRQVHRFFECAIVIGHEIYRAHIDFRQQQFGNRREPRFGVAHRCGAIAIARAEVADAVDQRIAQGKILRHTHHRIVSGSIAVRVVFAENLAHHARRLHRLGTGREAHVFHGI